MDRTERQEKEINVLDYLSPLFAWRWLILLGCLGGGAFGAYYHAKQRPVYKSMAYFLPVGALGETDELSRLGGETGPRWYAINRSSDIVQYYSRILLSRPIMEKMLDRPFSSEKHGRVPLREILGVVDDGTSLSLARSVESFRSLVQAGSAGGKIISVTVSTEEPQLSADLTNALMDEYLALPRLEEETSRTLRSIAVMLIKVELELTEKEDEIVNIESKTWDTKSETQILLARLKRDEQILIGRVTILKSVRDRSEIQMYQYENTNKSDIEVIERALPALKKSNVEVEKIVLLFALMGGFFTASFAFVVEYLRALRRENEGHVFWKHFRGTVRDAAILCVLLAALACIVFALKKGWVGGKADAAAPAYEKTVIGETGRFPQSRP